jgi:hypothetical protein
VNEVDYIRQQLAAERSHLRDILAAVRREATGRSAGPVTEYLDWAGPRLVRQLTCLQAALAAAPDLPPRQLADLSGVAQRAGSATPPVQPQSELLQSLLSAWSEPVDALAGRTLRTPQWRQVAHLSADSVLAERRLFAAARAAAGLA